MANQKLFMQTTKVDPLTTAGQIISLLVRSGARQINQTYDSSMALVGVSFTLEVSPGIVRMFTLPVRTEPIFKLINGGRSHNRGTYAKDDRQQSERVAWRQLLRWVEAQLAMIQTGMVEAAEIFLPYMTNESGVTFFELMKADAQKQLPAGS